MESAEKLNPHLRVELRGHDGVIYMPCAQAVLRRWVPGHRFWNARALWSFKNRIEILEFARPVVPQK